MTIVASTITEYHELLGEQRGEERGKKIGEQRGKIIGQIQLLERLHRQGVINSEQYDTEVGSLHQQLLQIESKD